MGFTDRFKQKNQKDPSAAAEKHPNQAGAKKMSFAERVGGKKEIIKKEEEIIKTVESNSALSNSEADKEEFDTASGKFKTIAKRADGDRVFLVTGDNQNKKAWYYVLVQKTKLPLFKREVQTDFIDLSLYGDILYCGWGEEPPEDISQKIKDEFY